ncbi:LCP family protein [Corynebacterium alimapuense]|uniref:LytR family transcriptional regulator n=1 Tax=Corynebacterium alimapuense TaxID=1576874 RepID=A0A3M8K884_9CORY|nr:LCP family protein [Corynebacterium alimapuense]RNE48762.1 LytR family transcriptional regulator [Corynebacterium alimapuense]
MSDKYRRVRDIQAAPPTAPSIRQAGPMPVKVILALLSTLVLLVSALGYTSVGRLGSEVASAGNLALGGGEGTTGQTEDGATDILLVGSDSRTDAQGTPLSQQELERLNAGVDDGEENTDTLMVIRVPNDGSSATAVSIPRDTYINDDTFGNLKINGVFAAHKAAEMEELVEEGAEDLEAAEAQATEAGRQGLVKAVTDLTGIEVDHFAEIGLFGFVLLTDAVGGVEVCLNEAVDDEFSGAQFPAGVQTLDGTEALAFVRQRHGLPRGDLDRIVRQQAFMASLVNQTLAAGTLTNPSKLSDISTAVERSVVIDENWDILSFATQLANLAGGNVIFTTIPVTSIDGVGDYGESIVTVDVDEVHEFMDDLLSPAESTESSEASTSTDSPEAQAAGTEIMVLNAGQTSGLAGGVGAFLEEDGFDIVEVTNAQPGVYYSSQIVAADADDPAAILLAEQLGGLPITTNDGLDTDTIIVVAADDYDGPQSTTTTGPTAVDEDPVGTPGAELGEDPIAPEIDAGGDGPQCVN